MKYDELNLQKIREVPIFDVCSKLGISLYGMGQITKRATCWYHDDKHPSMHVNKKKNIYKCFVCGKGGDVIRLVQDYENKSFIEACDWLINEFHIVVVPDTPIKTNTDRTDRTDIFKTNTDRTDRTDIFKTNTDRSDKTDTNESVKSVSSVVEKKKSFICPLPSDIVTRSLSVDSVFCKSVVSAGYLTQVQMVSAANRYRLGASKEGGVIFWEIDAQQQVHTGKIMYYQLDCHRDKQHTPTWVHSLMKSQLPDNYELQHCLFGLHLLTNTDRTDRTDIFKTNTDRTDKTDKNESVKSVSSVVKNNSVVCIVESEKTAVILSEIVKDFIWMSCGGLQMFKPELLAPLVNHKVVVFPDTDETGEAYKQWLTVLQQAAKLYPFKHPLRISNLLELHATADQKRRKIDLVDYLFHTDLTDHTD